MTKKQEIYSSLDLNLKVLKTLRRHKAMTAHEIAIKTCSTKVGVSSAIKFLREKGYIIESVNGRTGGYFYTGEIKKVSHRLNAREKKWIVKKYAKGRKIKDIMDLLRISKVTVYYQLNVLGIKTKRDKFKESQDDLIELYNEGCSLKEIAATTGLEYKYVKSNIYRLVEANRK